MTLLTPLGALVALAGLLVLGAAVLARGRTAAARRILGLPSPERGLELLPSALAAVAVAFLALAAAQPALVRTSSPRERSGVQALFVLDTSRSMAASSSPAKPTRLDRAVKAAIRLRAAIPRVESGVLTLTDRVLPDLLPVVDLQSFDGVVQRAVRIESPPPRESSVRATSYGALADIASGNDFAPSASRRIVILLTDGESNPVQSGDLAGRLAAAHGYRFMAIRFWRDDESVFDADGKPEAGYRPDPSRRAALRELAGALGGRSFDEGELGAAAGYLRGLAGHGPTVHVASADTRRVSLAPYAGLVGLFALLAALGAIPALAEIRLTRQ